jgi:tetratricopeptide (TPR) repeat protein
MAFLFALAALFFSYYTYSHNLLQEMYSKSLETAPLAGGQRHQLTNQGQESREEDAMPTAANDTAGKLAMLRIENRKNRSVYFANRAACFLALNEYENAASDCSNAIDLDPTYLKAYMRRAMAYEQLEEYDRGLDDAQHILKSIDSTNGFAKAYVARITPIAEKKREELKEEMMSKLKELGNSLLGNFGLSLDNFKAEQDPDTGSYSIKFSQ